MIKKTAKTLSRDKIIKCREDFGLFTFEGFRRVFGISLNVKQHVLDGDGNPKPLIEAVKDSEGHIISRPKTNIYGEIEYQKEVTYVDALFRSVNSLMYHRGGNQWWNIPPRCGKTTIGFVYHAAFAIGRNPKAKFMYITHQKELVKEKMRELDILMSSDYYKAIFPELKRDGRKNTLIFRTTEGGTIRGFSISGHVTGTGAGDSSMGSDNSTNYGGCIILDDLHDASSTYSRTTLINNCERFEQCITSRRNTADTPFLVIGQRISPYDIFGYLEKKSERQFNKIIIPAILDNGRSIDEARLPLSELRIKQRANPYVFYSQYMQEPPEPKWRIFQQKYFKMKKEIINNHVKRDLVVTIDLNSGSMKSLDRTAVSVFQVFFEKSDISYEPKRCGRWINSWVDKADPATIEHDIHDFLKQYENRLHAVIVEEHGIGLKVIADLRMIMPRTVILGSRRTRSKMEVFQSCSQFVEQGHIYMAEEMSEQILALIFDEFEKIHTESEYTDDIADTLSEFIIWFCERNKVGVPPPTELYNAEFLTNYKDKNFNLSVRSPFSF